MIGGSFAEKDLQLKACYEMFTTLWQDSASGGMQTKEWRAEVGGREWMRVRGSEGERVGRTETWMEGGRCG